MFCVFCGPLLTFRVAEGRNPLTTSLRDACII